MNDTEKLLLATFRDCLRLPGMKPNAGKFEKFRVGGKKRGWKRPPAGPWDRKSAILQKKESL